MPVGEIIKSDDTLWAVCCQLALAGEARLLALFSGVCKRTSAYLLSSELGATHWQTLARQVGIDHMGATRLVIKYTMCPWRIAPICVTPSAHHAATDSLWRSSRIFQFVAANQEVHVRCRIMAGAQDDAPMVTDSGCFVVSAKDPRNVLRVFRDMDAFDDVEYVWSGEINRIYGSLIEQCYIPDWVDDMENRHDCVQVFNLNDNTLLVAVITGEIPVLHIFNRLRNDGRLRYIRTIYVPRMATAAQNPVLVLQQNIWVLQNDGSILWWGLHGPDIKETSTYWRDSLYPFFCVLETDRADRAAEMFEKKVAAVRLGCNMVVPEHECGGTLLHAAVECNAWKVVQILLQAGANPNIKNDEGFTAMTLALKSSAASVSIGRLLRYYGGNPNIPNAEGHTALHLCINDCSQGYGSVSLLRDCLLVGGVDLSLASNGMKPLAYAVQEGYPSVVRLLLAHGAPTSDYVAREFDDGESYLMRRGRRIIHALLEEQRQMEILLG